jgi:hypothetical protein
MTKRRITYEKVAIPSNHIPIFYNVQGGKRIIRFIPSGTTVDEIEKLVGGARWYA